MASFAIDLQEMAGAIRDPKLSEAAALYQETYMSIPGLRIAGGTDEIMANIIAERVLGLPPEPHRPDDLARRPFDDGEGVPGAGLGLGGRPERQRGDLGKAIYQPRFMPYALIGVNIKL